MSIQVLFFAQTRELVGVDSLRVEETFDTAEALREHLSQQGPKWQLALEKGKLLVAINLQSQVERKRLHHHLG